MLNNQMEKIMPFMAIPLFDAVWVSNFQEVDL
jgi:hypothetical protein